LYRNGEKKIMISRLEVLPDWLQSYTERNLGTLWQVIRAYRANKRQGTVGVKTRAMVRCTGKKPYKQKKTGNARRGSFVSPLNVGGGVSHGPVARDYRQYTPVKMLQAALKIALSRHCKDGKVFVAESFVHLSGKTKEAAEMIKPGYTPIGKTVVCMEQLTPHAFRALRNIRGVHLVSPQNLNAFHVVFSRRLITTKNSLDLLQTRLCKDAK